MKKRYTAPSLLLPLISHSLKVESSSSSEAVPRLLSCWGPIGGRSNSIWVTVLTCVPDSESDVQPFSLTLDAFLSDSINLDIITGMRLSKNP